MQTRLAQQQQAMRDWHRFEVKQVVDIAIMDEDSTALVNFIIDLEDEVAELKNAIRELKLRGLKQ